MAALAAMLWLASRPSPAQAPEGDPLRQEYNLKLAYLYSFGRYVEWPAGAFASADKPFVIGVLGADPFHGALDEIARSRRIQGRPIVARYFATSQDYQPCHVLFLARSVPQAEQDEVLRKLRGTAVLLVGESEGFAARGGGVNFYRDQENIRFEINVEALRAAHLQINAKLLSLARLVKGE